METMPTERTIEDIQAEALALGIHDISNEEEVYKRTIALSEDQNAVMQISNLQREYTEKTSEHQMAA
jgi:hypothetical protein